MFEIFQRGRFALLPGVVVSHIKSNKKTKKANLTKTISKI